MLTQVTTIARHLGKLSKPERDAAIKLMSEAETEDARHIRLAITAWKSIKEAQRAKAMELLQTEFAE